MDTAKKKEFDTLRDKYLTNPTQEERIDIINKMQNILDTAIKEDRSKPKEEYPLWPVKNVITKDIS